MEPPENPYRSALTQLDRNGGVDRLPETITISLATHWCGCSHAWLNALFYQDALPGSSFGSQPQWWRCHRQTFVEWLEEHADEYQYTMARVERNHSPHPAPTCAHLPRRGRTTL